MIRVKVVGACGYGGVGISELLYKHPKVATPVLVDIENVGQPLSALYPHLTGFVDTVVISPDDPRAQEPFDVVFMSTPDGVGMELAKAELAKGAKVIDYSGDFRFNNIEDYAGYASRLGRSTQHAAPELLSESVYGVPELHRSKIGPNLRLVGNPGCFAVSCILGLAPAAASSLIEPKSVICDCKTGVSGAGKKPNASFHYPARYDMMNAYRLAGHQHVYEIEREVSLLAGEPVMITFTAQAVPVCRGIMSTLYGTLKTPATEAEVLEVYREFHKNNPFVRVFDSQSNVGSMHVRGTNYCNLVVSVDERVQRLRVVSYIDNLVKGQAGSALQNMNLLFGFDEGTGLTNPGSYP